MNDLETFTGMAYCIGVMFVLFCVGKLWQGYSSRKKQAVTMQYHLSDETRKSISSFNRELEKKGEITKNAKHAV